MSTFSSVAKKLIKGTFICEYSHPSEFNFLKKAGMAGEIDGYLRKMDFKLSVTNDGEAYYCSYVTPKEHISELKRQFTDIIESMMPLVDFLIFVQQSRGSDDVIRPGETIRMTELQSVVEDTPALSLQLDKIAAHTLFKSQSPSVDGKLKQVLKKLVEMDYLTLSNPAYQIYQSTSKWSLLLEQIRFINETERLSLESQTKDLIKQEDLYE